MTYELHPLCTLFPRLSGAEFDALRDDIKANGLRQPIVLHDGMILDGGNRYAACLAAGIEPSFTPFDGGNVVAFVLSANLHRRHMSPGQQAAIVASAQDWAKAELRGGDRRSDQSATLHFDRAEDRAMTSGASLRTQKMADKVAKADPELAKQVAHGEVSLPAAVKKVQQRGKPPKAGTPKAALLSAMKALQASEKEVERLREQLTGGASSNVGAAAPPKTARQLEAERVAEEAHGDFDPLAELEQAQAEIKRMAAELQVAEAHDLKAEALKWRRISEAAQRGQADAMDRAKQTADREAWTMRQLRRCGKAVGQDDPAKIAAAVEAMARATKKEQA